MINVANLRAVEAQESLRLRGAQEETQRREDEVVLAAIECEKGKLPKDVDEFLARMPLERIARLQAQYRKGCECLVRGFDFRGQPNSDEGRLQRRCNKAMANVWYEWGIRELVPKGFTMELNCTEFERKIEVLIMW